MRNHKLENNILEFIGKYQDEYVDADTLIKEFKKIEPLYIYDAIVSLRKNKLIERKSEGQYYYYKKL